MSQTSHLKSLSITNLDTTPVIQNTTGEGASGKVLSNNDYATTVAADTTGSTYQLVRIPSNAKVKAVVFESEAQGAGKISLSVYYSDSAVDGTQASLQGLIVTATPGGVGFFAVDIDCSSAVGPTNETNQSGVYTLNLRNQPIWQALGLASDPGGFFDVVAVVHTTAITTGAARLGARVEYVM